MWYEDELPPWDRPPKEKDPDEEYDKWRQAQLDDEPWRNGNVKKIAEELNGVIEDIARFKID